MEHRQSADAIETQALEWLWRLDREDDPAVRSALDAWLAEDPRRQGAWLKAQAIWSMLDVARDSAAEPAEATPEGLDGGGRRARTTRRALIAGGGALGALAAGLAVAVMTQVRYGTAIGEIRRVPLADGSEVALNTQSLVSVNLKPKRRIVTLNHGEAWFHVAKDSARPFIVEAGPVRVRAVGTAFSVRRRADGADVLVTEGVVETWAEGGEAHKLRLAAGGAAFVADNAAIVERPTEPSGNDRKLAWRDGHIDLRGESLADAVAEFNRYNTRKLTVADSRIAAEPLYGVFRTDDPAGFATAVASSLNASVTQAPDGALRLAAR